MGVKNDLNCGMQARFVTNTSTKKRTANDLLAELNADVIDVEENVSGTFVPVAKDSSDDVLENRDDVDSQEEDPNYCGNLDNAMINNKS